MNTSTLTLTFNKQSFDKFHAFLDFQVSVAGSYINADEINVYPEGENNFRFEITSDADTHYRIGYDWALWQFPPTK